MDSHSAKPAVQQVGLLAAGTLVQCYRIASVIRAGTINNVYAAIDERSGASVALKEYFPRVLGRRLPSGRIGIANDSQRQQFEAGVRGFINEAIALSVIKSNLLVQFVAAFRENGTAYVVTEFEAGCTLEEWARAVFQQPGQFPGEADLRVIFWMLLHAVQAMHEKGYLHLDIKPSNVIMRDVQTPILIDLGGARRFPPEARRDITVSNYTPGFAAPEQCEAGTALGPATDIYGIGASILYCMTGRQPPHARTRRQDDQVEQLLAQCAGRYSPALIEIVRRCLLLDSGARHGDVERLQNLIAAS